VLFNEIMLLTMYKCRHVEFKGTMKKWPVQKQTHRTAQKKQKTPRRNRHSEKTLFLCVTDCFTCFIIYDFLNYFSKKCYVTALVRSMTFVGVLNSFKLRQYKLQRCSKKECCKQCSSHFLNMLGVFLKCA